VGEANGERPGSGSEILPVTGARIRDRKSEQEKTMHEHAGTTRTDVLVVGAGPTGLTLALQLRRLGVGFRLLDKNPKPSTTSKAIGLQYRVSEVLSWMGLADEFLAESATSQKVNMYATGGADDGPILQLNLGGLGIGGGKDAFVPRMMMIPQSETERLLIEALEERGGNVERGATFLGFEQNDERVVSRVRRADGREERIGSRYLVSCEGAHSVVRKQAGISFAGETYPFAFVMADVALDWDRNREEIYSWLHEDGTFSAGPLPGNRWRLFIEVGERVPEVTLDLVQKLLTERTGDRTARVKNPTWLSEFRINSRMVDRFREGRVFLAGDAAHVHSPSGGQGITTGMQDAYNLSWKLAQVIRENAPDALLDTYGEERLPIVREVLGTTERNTALLFPRSRAGKLLRNTILLPLLRREGVQRKLVRKMSQLDMNYRGSSLSAGEGGLLSRPRGRKGRVRAGDRTPDVVFRDAETGEKIPLFALLRGSRPIALIGGEASRETAERTIHALDRLGIEGFSVLPRGGAAGSSYPGTCLEDVYGDFRRLYGARGGFLYLIRPDGYAGLVQERMDVAALRAYLNRLFSADRVDAAFNEETAELSVPAGSLRPVPSRMAEEVSR
jgi:2-polyprenyl-6-methoxyphenol hydroxylase-like FAD-dependent oxidoreductase